MGTLGERRMLVLPSEVAVLHLKLTCPCWQVSSDISEFLVLQQKPEVCVCVCVCIYIYIFFLIRYHPVYKCKKLIIADSLLSEKSYHQGQTHSQLPVCKHLTLYESRLFVTPWTVAHQAPLSMNSPGKNTEVGSHSLLQGIFLTQGLNPGLPHYKQIL